MKLCFITVIASFLLIPVFLVHAQTPCGNIVTPDNFHYEGSSEQLQPIQNCDDPFGKTGDINNFQVNQNVVQSGSVYEVTAAGTQSYGISDENYYRAAGGDYYRHSGTDYVRVHSDFFEPTVADITNVLRQYFNGNESQAAKYTPILMADDYFPYVYDDVTNTYYFDSVANDYVWRVRAYAKSYVEAHMPPLRAALLPGTYTVVLNEGGGGPNPSYQNNFIHKFFTSIISTAYAAETVKTITFTLSGPTPEVLGASSVLFLPGIMSSRLYTRGILGAENQLWETNGNADVRKLLMSESGTSINTIYTRDIPGTVYLGLVSIYGGFINYMDTLVSEHTIHAWKPFAYDWRYSVDDIANNGTKYETEVKNAIDEIELLASNSFSKKVTLVGHSNGGLLAKAIMIRLEALGKSNLVDTVVLLATPQLGTPKAIGSILHGYDQELGKGFIVDDWAARDSMKNMPSAYGLLPSQAYFSVTTSTIIRFDSSTSTKLFRNAYGDTVDSLSELSRFITGSGDARAEAYTLDDAVRGNSSLLQKEFQLHNTLDNWIAPNGVRVVEVIGTGLDTVSGFEYRGFRERVCYGGIIFNELQCPIVDIYKPVPVISQSGDQTVMLPSAEGYRGEKKQYYIDLKKIIDTRKEEAVQHFNITESPSIQQLVKNILLATSSPIDFITEVPNVVASNRIMFGSHSPVSLTVKDKQGRRVGREVSNNFAVPTEEIPGSSYFEVGSSSYIIVPDGKQYDVSIAGTNYGGLTLSVDRLKGEVQMPTVSVQVATITPSTTISVSYTNTALGNLAIDQNGDGVTDQVLTPQALDVTPKVTYTSLRNSIQKLALSNLRKAALLLLATTAEALDKNPKLSALETLALNQLEALLISYQKSKWITQEELTTLKGIINKLK